MKCELLPQWQTLHGMGLDKTHSPCYRLNDAINFIGGRRITPTGGEDQVDGVKESRQGLGQVSSFIGLQ